VKNTHDFVEDLHDRQKKAEKNEKKQGEGNFTQRLPSKQHNTNK
jgi:hypothetical protein